LENVLLQGVSATIVGLSSVLRVPLSEDDNSPNLIMSQPLVGSSSTSAQYMAPELFNEEAFDGYTVDLWSASVMLFAMLVGIDALFLLPSPQDYRFKEICIECNLEKYLQKIGRTISAEAADLLQTMLTVDPAGRLTRKQVEQHVWVTQHTDPPDILPSSSYQ
jgi:serine/threonine protein kinase